MAYRESTAHLSYKVQSAVRMYRADPSDKRNQQEVTKAILLAMGESEEDVRWNHESLLKDPIIKREYDTIFQKALDNLVRELPNL